MKTRKRKKRKLDVEAILGSPIVRCFDFLRIVEEEIEAAGVPRRTGCPLFLSLTPGDRWETIQHRDTWRAHAREKIRRYKAATSEKERRQALTWGTNVEAALELLRVSHAVPLNRNGLATLRLASIGTPLEEFTDPEWRPRFDGQAERDLRDIRRKIAR